MIHKPYSLRQRVSIVAHESTEFGLAMESISALSAYLQQESLDGPVDNTRLTRIFGMECIDAQTSLFTSKNFSGHCDDATMPHHMDPDGRLQSQARRKSYRYTTENEVLYGEISSVSKITYVLPLCAVIPVVNRCYAAKTRRSFLSDGRSNLASFDMDSS